MFDQKFCIKYLDRNLMILYEFMQNRYIYDEIIFIDWQRKFNINNINLQKKRNIVEVIMNIKQKIERNVSFKKMAHS